MRAEVCFYFGRRGVLCFPWDESLRYLATNVTIRRFLDLIAGCSMQVVSPVPLYVSGPEDVDPVQEPKSAPCHADGHLSSVSHFAAPSQLRPRGKDEISHKLREAAKIGRNGSVECLRAWTGNIQTSNPNCAGSSLPEPFPLNPGMFAAKAVQLWQADAYTILRKRRQIQKVALGTRVFLL